jgi:ribosomal protein L37E
MQQPSWALVRAGDLVATVRAGQREAALELFRRADLWRSGDELLLTRDWEQSIRCPQCGMRSYSPVDVEQGYCGNCRAWTTRRG